MHYTLTTHARDRLSERTKLDEAALMRCIEVGVRLDMSMDVVHEPRLIWSDIDDMAYMVIFNRFTREILTIMPAYTPRDDGTLHMAAYGDRDIYGVHINDVSHRIRVRDLVYLRAKLGLPPREFVAYKPVQSNPAEAEAVTSASKSTRFIIKARFRFEDGQYRSVTLHKKISEQDMHETSLASLCHQAQLLLQNIDKALIDVAIEIHKDKPDPTALLADWILDGQEMKSLANSFAPSRDQAGVAA